jgi:ABC-type multidrug transport system ATPase subunit
MATCITFENVSKSFGETVAVDDLTLEIKSGEILGVLGPNGAGKSTFLYMLSGLMRPTSGTITIFGKELRTNFVEIAGRMGVLVERPALCDYLSVERNLKLQARLAGREVNVKRALDLAGIVNIANRRVDTLSMGMRQRLGLAQAMLTEPELLILDEPTQGLDAEATQEMLLLLRRLADEAAVTVVISSHLMQEVEMLCDRVAIMHQGELVACEDRDAMLAFDRTHVEVLLDGAEGAARKLVKEPWVESVVVKPGRLEVHLQEGATHQLNSFLINSGYQVSGIIPRRRTLQDYFLKVLNA